MESKILQRNDQICSSIDKPKFIFKKYTFSIYKYILIFQPGTNTTIETLGVANKLWIVANKKYVWLPFIFVPLKIYE